MKRSLLVILSIVLFLAVALGGAALMYLSPRGILNPDGPEEAMQNYIETGAYAWRDEFCRLYTPETTVFEDSGTVAGNLFDALAGDSDFRFREYEGVSSGAAPVYILSGDDDLLTVKLEYMDGSWQAAELAVPAELFTAQTHTVTVTVPSDAEVFLNGVAVDCSYIESDNVPYDDLTALEARFDAVPHRVRYAVPGIFEKVQVSVSRPEGAVLQSTDGLNWVYTVPDAGAYSFAVTAPADAVVTVNGAELTPEDRTGEVRLTPLVDIPEELVDLLPVYCRYEAEGLYSQPELSAVGADGAALPAAASADGSIRFTDPGSETLYAEHHERVEKFIENLAEYGAGHTTRAYPNEYTVPESDLWWYVRNASGSLVWVVGVSVSYDELTSYDYIPLGEDAFLCRAHLVCSTQTGYQTADLDLEYEMLWVRSGEKWLAADLAFTDNFERTKAH